MSRIPGPDQAWYRWIAGQPLDGHYRTDATFFRPGQKQLGKTPSRRWSYRPGWQRSAIRNGTVVGSVGIAWEYHAAPSRTLIIASVVIMLAAVYAVLRAWKAWSVRKRHNRYVRPLGIVLGPLLGYSLAVRPADFVTVPQGWEKDETKPVVIMLPETFSGTEGVKAQVSEVVLGRLGKSGDQMSVNFRLSGKAPSVHATYRPQPPKMYPLKDAIEAIRELEPGQVLIGMKARNKTAVMDFNCEDPHMVVNANTGTGKSTQLMVISAQIIRNGGHVFAIDPKITSFDPIVGVEGFHIANDPSDVEGMWSLIREVHTEFKKRRIIFGKDRTAEFPLWFLMIDEMTMFRKIDRQYWSEIKEKKDLMTSPGAKMLDELILMGRQYGFRVIASGQIINEAIMWNNLSVFANRTLAKYDENAWKRLFGGFSFEVPSTRPGRWIYRFGGGAPEWAQNVYATDQELRELALERSGSGVPAVVPSEGESVPSGDDGSEGTWDIVGLQAAADYAGISVEAFKRRRLRAEGIPGESKVKGQYVFMRSDLDAFLNRTPSEAP